MVSFEAARVLMLITLIISVAIMPLAYIAKHRWYNKRLTQTLSTIGTISVIIFISLAIYYMPD
jgi:uncharacterized membrane protein YcfT